MASVTNLKDFIRDNAPDAANINANADNVMRDMVTTAKANYEMVQMGVQFGRQMAGVQNEAMPAMVKSPSEGRSF
jgi:hypothetical protein